MRWLENNEMTSNSLNEWWSSYGIQHTMSGVNLSKCLRYVETSSEYIAPVGQLCVVPDHFLADYMDWFYMISHPFMSPAQSGDPHRVSPIQQYDTFVEPNVY